MTKRSGFIGCLVALMLFAGSAPAAEISVRKDGTGDHTSIAAAVAAASANDTITVGPGTYFEPFIDVIVPIHLRSESGPELTFVDGQNANRFFRFVSDTTVEGFTFTSGRAVAITNAGGAIIIGGYGATVIIDNCRFLGNTADNGGAFYITHATTVATFTDCSFEDNYAPTIGGAISVVMDAVVNVDRCSFKRNSTDMWGGAIHAASGTTLNISGSLFSENISDNVAGAIYMYLANGTIETSTFWRNHSSGESSGTLTIQSFGGLTVSRNIFAEDTAGFGIYFFFQEAPHNCNVFSNNLKGAVSGGTLTVDEVESDPFFCDALSGIFALSDLSPAAASHSECGLLIGAFDVGCGAVGTEEKSWGRIKSLYRSNETDE